MTFENIPTSQGVQASIPEEEPILEVVTKCILDANGELCCVITQLRNVADRTFGPLPEPASGEKEGASFRPSMLEVDLEVDNVLHRLRCRVEDYERFVRDIKKQVERFERLA
jgi:hypothetical protein